MSGRVLLLIGCSFLGSCLSQQSATPGLSFEFLQGGTELESPLPYLAFAPGAGSQPASNTFSGRLVLDTAAQSNFFELQHDALGLVTPDRPGVDRLPEFDFEFLQDGASLIPVTSGPVINDHGWWEYAFGAGRVWDTGSDKGWSRAAIPFALVERRENCTHNGVMTFLFRDDGRVSNVAFQIVSQTCSYLKFEMAGLLSADYERVEVDGAEQIVTAAREYREHRMPTRNLKELAKEYPGADAAAFGSVEEIDPDDMTTFGFVIDGIHYIAACHSPYGNYPYCDDMAIPSYSTAKSLVGGLGLMLLEAAYPGSASTPISSVVEECGESWHDVSIEHALDMTTGHFELPDMHGDENAATNGRFFLSDHAGKIDVACNGYPRKADPGTHLSYHTWDTYLAGVAMNNVLKQNAGSEADFFDDLLVKQIWQPLGLSTVAANTRRTYDEESQPYTGYGLTFLRDDVAKLANFIGPQDGQIGERKILYRPMFDAIKQRVAGDPGMIAELDTIRYNNGFRSFDVSSYLGCENSAWVVVLSGFGGITIAIMPNDTAYYYFSDGSVFRYLSAVREAHRIRSMCS